MAFGVVRSWVATNLKVGRKHFRVLRSQGRLVRFILYARQIVTHFLFRSQSLALMGVRFEINLCTHIYARLSTSCGEFQT